MNRHSLRVRSLALLFGLLPALGVQAATTGQAYKEFDGVAGFLLGTDVPLAGITVRAYSATGALVATTTTIADGTYTLATSDGNVQIAFEMPGYAKAQPGASNTTSELQFVNDPIGVGNATANLVVTNPAEVCPTPADANFVDGDDANPGVSFCLFRQGDQSTEASIRHVNFDAANAAFTAPGVAPEVAQNVDARVQDVGSVYGLAYHRASNRLLAGGYLRRHTELGPNLTPAGYTNPQANPMGQIFLINRDGSNTVSLFADINDINNSVTATGADPRGATAWNYFYDAPALGTDAVRNAAAVALYQSVGRTGLGDVDLSEDGRVLYVVGLRDRRLYQLDASVLYTNANPAPRTAFLNPSVAIPTDACTSAADAQPFALDHHEGVLYVGVTCTAESTTTATGNTRGTLSQLEAAVYRFNTSTQTFDATPVLEFPLTFPRGCTEGGTTDNVSIPNAGCTGSPTGDKRAFWQPWNLNWNIPYNDPSQSPNVGSISQNDFFIEYPQPLLADIDFDRDGFMMLGFRDITGDRVGTCTAGPDVSEITPANCDDPAGDAVAVRALGLGDHMCASPNGSGGFNLEADGVCGTRSANNEPQGVPENGQGPDGPDANLVGGEFFWNDQGPGAAATLLDGMRDSGLTGHGETMMGSFAVAAYLPYGGRTTLVPGPAANLTGQTVSSWLVGGINDPTQFYDQGLIWSSTSNGQSHKRSLITDSSAVVLGTADTGKGSGMGDIELVCSGPATTVVGNRVWFDTSDNFQGADITDSDSNTSNDEPGVAGVDLILYNAAGTQVGRTTTAAGGFYNFTFTVGATDPITTDASVILPNPYSVGYFVVIDPAEFAVAGTLEGRGLAAANQTSAIPVSADDLRDSDATAQTVPVVGARAAVIQFTLTAPGENNFTLDFGLSGLDFGDLPDSGSGVGAGNYETLSSSGGASNLINNNLRLGLAVTGAGIAGYDTEATGVPTANADGDNNANTNDENGVTFPAIRQGVAPTIALSVFNNTGATQNVCGYIDFNGDGQFTGGEIAPLTTVGTSASPQAVNLAFTGTLPVSAQTNNNLYSRFRVQTAACSANGFGGSGEVEDYAVPVTNVTIASTATGSYCPGQAVTYTITLTNPAASGTATAFPVTADLVGIDDAGLAGVPLFANVSWAVTTTSGGASLAATTGSNVDINTTATIPAGGTIVITVQGTFANATTGLQAASANILPVAGVANRGATDSVSGNYTQNTAATCQGQPTGGGALCPSLTTPPAALNCSGGANTVVNAYHAGTANVPVGSRCIRVNPIALTGSVGTIAAGDVLLVMQMQDADINSTDTSSYGDGTAGAPGGALAVPAATAGRYEYVIAQTGVQTGPVATGPCAGQSNVIEISGANAPGAAPGGGTINSYSVTTPDTFQVVRVRVAGDVTFTAAACSFGAPPWNGSAGGIVAIDSTGSINLGSAPTTVRFDAISDGFQGGVCANNTPGSTTSQFASATAGISSQKGEGAAGVATSLLGGSLGLGAPATGGGSGQTCNATNGLQGAGGGANGGTGGNGGGGTAATCTTNPGGHGGGVLSSLSNTRLTLGGGGGAGSRLTGATTCDGGVGGGIVILRANSLGGSGTINADASTTPGSLASNRAGGGGGAGGTVIVQTSIAGGTTYTGITITANGGAAVSNTGVNAGGSGGGGGGRILLAQTAAAPAGTRTANGGAFGNTAATDGTVGAVGTITLALDPVNSSPGVKPAYICAQSSTVPVTIAAVQVTRSNGEVVVDFTTASEAGTVGYRVLTDVGASPSGAPNALLNAELTRAAVDTLLEQRYVVRGRDLGVQAIWIEELAIDGKATLYGPYQVGASIGERNLAPGIPWGAIAAEQTSFRVAQQLALRANRSTTSAVAVAVSTDQWLRLSYEQLLAQGVDLNGLSASQIALTQGSRVLPVHLSATSMGPGQSLSFYAEAVRGSLYTRTATYRIAAGAGQALSVRDFGAPATTGLQSLPYRERFDANKVYSFSSPTADPWFMARIFRSGNSAAVWEFPIDLPQRSVDSRGERLALELWGGLDYPEDNDHSVIVRLNGVELGRRRFDGVTALSLSYAIPTGLLRTGGNTLSLELPADTGQGADIVNVEAIDVHYSRELLLSQNQLAVTLPDLSGVLMRDGFEVGATNAAPSASTLVFRGVTAPVQVLLEEGAGAFKRLHRISSTQIDGSTLRVQVQSAPGSRLRVEPIASANVHSAPVIADPIGQGQADLLIISHPSFIDGLGSYVNAKQAQGTAVKVLDVEAIYRSYNGGVVDPAAIELAIRDAVQKLGIRYVLLVGGDTYDYANNLGIGSLSLIPTSYRRISSIIAYAPADSVYADTNGDGASDLALGRWPVRSQDELQRVIAKSLQFPQASGARRALFIADRQLGTDRFQETLGDVAPLLGSTWSSELMGLDDVPSGSASVLRNQIVERLNSGVRVLAFYGHSAPSSWSREGLITATQVYGGLFNQVSQPPAVLQLGCWATYFVDPNRNTIAHGMLLQPGGASAVLGASSVTETTADFRFARELLPRVGSGQTLGDALRNTQQAMQQAGGSPEDIVTGGTLLGDPTLKAD